MNDQLGDDHISALFALMGAAQEISNNELYELAGFRIDGALRKTLNERHLVVSTRQGNKPYVHELTDAGWKRCEAELSAGPLKATKFMAGAFHMVLSGLDRQLQREKRILANVFQPEAAAVAEEPAQQAAAEPVTEATIATLYRRLAEKQGDWVPLARLRPLLGDTPRAEVDRVLKDMSKARRAHLAPDPDRKSLTADDRDAAIRIGGEDNHLIVVARS
jgi:hypothetical protein